MCSIVRRKANKEKGYVVWRLDVSLVYSLIIN